MDEEIDEAVTVGGRDEVKPSAPVPACQCRRIELLGHEAMRAQRLEVAAENR